MGKPKGSPKTGGRKKGTPNKIASLRSMIFEALERRGGVPYLEGLDDRLFATLLARCVPQEVKAEVEGGITVVVSTGVPERANSVK